MNASRLEHVVSDFTGLLQGRGELRHSASVALASRRLLSSPEALLSESMPDQQY